MKKPFSLVSLCSFAAGCAMLAVGACLFVGACEVESASGGSLSVSPSKASVYVGQSVTFRASGGEVYTWTLDNADLGRLSSSQGESVTYTATGGSGQTVLLYVSTGSGRVTSSGSSDGTSNPSTTGTTTTTTRSGSTSAAGASRTISIRHL